MIPSTSAGSIDIFKVILKLKLKSKSILILILNHQAKIEKLILFL